MKIGVDDPRIFICGKSEDTFELGAVAGNFFKGINNQ